MNKKVEAISQHPLGIIPCNNDPDIYNVYSFSADYRIVDMLIFECSCPRNDKSFCSHIRAISKKFEKRYTRELFNLFAILNEINLKCSLANCNDKANNHLNLLIKSIHQCFHFKDLFEISELKSFEAKQRYKRVICAILKALSSISWRFYLMRINDQGLVNSIKYASSSRNSICINSLIDSIDSSLSKTKREEFSSATEFLRNIELSSFETIGLFNSLCITDFLSNLISKNVLKSSNKKVLIKNIIEYLQSCGLDLYLKDQKENENSFYYSLFGQKIIQTLKKIPICQLTESLIDMVLIENFGVKLNSLGFKFEAIIKKLKTETSDLNLSSIFDLFSLKLYDQDAFCNVYNENSLKVKINKEEIINMIYHAPILVDLNDYLLWYSMETHMLYGELEDFIHENESNEKLASFLFLRFSTIHKSFSSSKIYCNNKFSIYKISKPNQQNCSSSNSYYLNILKSIINCDGINALNYFIGGCIQENGIYNFINCFPIENLYNELDVKNKNFDTLTFTSSILNACPPLIITDIWDYFVIPLMNILLIKNDRIVLSLFKNMFNSRNWFGLNNLIKVAPKDILEKTFIEAYDLKNKDLNRENNKKPNHIELCKFKKFHEDLYCEIKNNIEKCQLCINKKNITNHEYLINSIREKYGISNNKNINETSRNLIYNYLKIINQSCKNLSIHLYTRVDHFVFELVQNADDNDYCTCIGKYPTLIFKFYNNGILVLNNEIGFNKKDVESICDIGNSSKLSRKKIGNFGIGFKSVFLITDSPYIFSNGYNFMFNSQSETSSYILPEWINKDLFEIIPSENNSEIEFELLNYSTKIWLPYSKSYLDSNSQINNINEDILLFTNNLKVIKLIQNSHSIIITKTDNSIFFDVSMIKLTKQIFNLKDEVHIKKRKLSVDVFQKKFIIVSYDLKKEYKEFAPKILEDTKKSSIIKIGIQLTSGDSYDGECISDIKMLYSFLPIRSYGFKFLLQADFDLTSSRESISIDSSWNLFIRDHIPSALLYAISKWCEMDNFPLLKKSFINIIPLKEDISDSFFNSCISKFIYLLRQQNCIYTIVNSFTKPINSVFIENTSLYENLLVIFPKIEEFSFLLNKYCNMHLIHKYIVARNEKSFLKNLGVKEFDVAMLIDIIDGMIRDFSYFGRPYPWYFNLLHLLENILNLSVDPNLYYQKLQCLPLFLSEEDRYVGLLNDKTNKKQLFFCIDDLFSIHKLGIHFIKKEFITELESCFTSDKITYNKIITFMENIGIEYISKSEYTNIILDNLSENSQLNTDDIIYFTSIIASTASDEELINKKIIAVSSKNEILILCPKNFHLLHEKNNSSFMNYFYKLIIQNEEFEKYSTFFSSREFNPKYLNYGDEYFWNNFFRIYGITELPFYFEKIPIERKFKIDDLNFLYTKHTNLIEKDIIKTHIETLIEFAEMEETVIFDYICIGIEPFSLLLGDLMAKYQEIKDIENTLLLISQYLCNYICENWDNFKQFWFVDLHKKAYSFVKLQFSNLPIFPFYENRNNEFTFKGFSSSKNLTLFRETELHYALSPFIVFYITSLEDDHLPIISDVFSSFTIITIDYLILLLRSIHNISINTIKMRRFNLSNEINSYIHLICKTVEFSKNIIINSKYDSIKNEIFLPIKLKSEFVIWKSLDELYWNDDTNILPKYYSLSFLFSSNYSIDSDLSDVLKFFITFFDLKYKPNTENFVLHLKEIFKNNLISISSEDLFVFLKIIIYLFDSKFEHLFELFKVPVMIDNRCCIWKPFCSNELNLFFSTSANVYYFIFNNYISINQMILWSPILYLFSKENIVPENTDLNILIEKWNALCKQKFFVNNEIKIDKYPTFSQITKSHIYKDIMSNLLGPLLEESSKNYSDIPRNNWSQILSQIKVCTIDSNLFISYINNSIKTVCFFEKTSSTLYIKELNKLELNEISDVALCLLTSITDSFLNGAFKLNSKCITITNLLFKYIIRDVRKLELEIDWKKCIIYWIREIEEELDNYTIDLKYFLFSDYKTKFVKTNVENETLPLQIKKEKCPQNITLNIGRKGEYAGYLFFKQKYLEELEKGILKIDWVNKNQETGLPYDILLTFTIDNKIYRKVYVEVKSSSSKEKNYFYITHKEWQFAEKSGENYWILQVLGIKLSYSKISEYDYCEYKLTENLYESCRNGNLKIVISEL